MQTLVAKENKTDKGEEKNLPKEEEEAKVIPKEKEEEENMTNKIYNVTITISLGILKESGN